MILHQFVSEKIMREKIHIFLFQNEIFGALLKHTSNLQYVHFRNFVDFSSKYYSIPIIHCSPPQTPPPLSPFPLVSPPLFSESKKYSFCRMKRSFWDYIFAIKGSVKNVSEISKVSAYNFR